MAKTQALHHNKHSISKEDRAFYLEMIASAVASLTIMLLADIS
jgi:hypothetical protein